MDGCRFDYCARRLDYCHCRIRGALVTPPARQGHTAKIWFGAMCDRLRPPVYPPWQREPPQTQRPLARLSHQAHNVPVGCAPDEKPSFMWQTARPGASFDTRIKRGAQIAARSHFIAITERADNLSDTQRFSHKVASFPISFVFFTNQKCCPITYR